ncbi:MAG: shikimate kinase [Actinomycetota bacterium]|nr:shikimate kinase [Actinomycetota bacterium]
MADRILLIGMMGAGKSSVGRLVAARLTWAHLDSDERIQKRTGRTVPQIFAERGEAAFRAEEAQVLAEAVTGSEPCVVSVAGGAVLSADNRRLLRSGGLVVWLRAELPTLATRVGRAEGRPLLNRDPLEDLTRLYTERRPLYQDLADVAIDVDHISPSDVADKVVAAHHAHRVRAAQRDGAGA